MAVSLASAEASADRVRLAWTIGPVAVLRATVSRATNEGGTWAELGSPVRLGADRLEFEDRTVVPGTRYGYRLTVWAGEEETRTEPVWVTVPVRAILRLVGASPNPAAREAEVLLTLPGDQRATLELFDLKGRRIAGQEVGVLGAGEHRVSLADARGLPAGVYLVRLTQERRVLTAKACVVK